MIQTFNKLKTFNAELLALEVEAQDLPKHYMWFAGFEKLADGRYKPAVTNRHLNGVATKEGDLHYSSETTFTAPEIADLERVIEEHDAKADSPAQSDLALLKIRVARGILPEDLELVARILLRQETE